MVRAGEASGSLDVVLDRLAEFGENQHAIRSRIKAALLYPLFMAIVGIIVLFLLITFIVPSITSVFEGTKQALPVPTIILIAISSLLKQFWWAVLIAVLGTIAAARWYIRHPCRQDDAGTESNCQRLDSATSISKPPPPVSAAPWPASSNPEFP